MSEAQLDHVKTEGIFQHDLRDDAYLACLKGKYISFLASNYGFKGRCTLIHTAGGNNVLTSSSSSLLQQLSFLHPSFKYINALISAQNRAFGVHGLYVGLLCGELLYRVLRLEESVPFPIISEVSLWIMEELMQRFEQHRNILTLNLDLGNISAVLNFVRSVLSSKGHRFLSLDEIKHVALKIVEAYLKTFPTDPKYGFSHIHITTLEGPSSLQTRLFEGLLYREPNYSYKGLHSILSRLPKGDLKVLLLNIPLSHEASSTSEGVEWCGENQLEFVYNELFSTLFKKCLKEKDIHILANQKYIHPMVKHELEREGILVMERLGLSLAQSLMQISGCCPVVQLSNLDSDINEDTLGHLSHIDSVVIDEKLFLNLRSIRASQNSTLLLSGINNHVVDYLKEAVDSCICLLRLAAQDPTMIVGGGCLEAFFSCIIAEMKKESSSLAIEFDATLSDVSKIFDAFISVFSWLAILPAGGIETGVVNYSIDSSHGHLWEIIVPPDDEGNSNSEGMALNPERCCCKSLFKRELESNVSFTPLPFLKDDAYLHRKPLFARKLRKKICFDEASIPHHKTHSLPSSQSQPSCLSMCKGHSQSNCYTVSNSYSQSISLSAISDSRLVYPNEVDFHGPSNSDHLNQPPLKKPEGAIQWRENCILDYYAAKKNAVRLAFEGFSELHQIGVCIFDK